MVGRHPRFYRSFGFVPASRHALRCEFDVPDDVFMVVELVRASVGGVGVVVYDGAFRGIGH